MITKIKKRDGRIVKFDQSKITNAVHKAINAVKAKDGKLAKSVSNKVTKILNKRFTGKIPSVEDIQDLVVEVLVKQKHRKIARAYILYRQKQAKKRAIKWIGIKPELNLSINALSVLQKRYLLRNKQRRIIETPIQMFMRVAKAVASADRAHGYSNIKELELDFYEMMANLEFLPNSPTLMNAGTPLGQLSACFVLPIEDSLESIFDAIDEMAMIQQSGGGTGFSFSKIRPKGDIVGSTKGKASGPVSFMKVFNSATEVIKQGGKRRGANMGILDVNHPDIKEFITIKTNPDELKNFNLSVAVTNKFMRAVKQNKKYSLINPRNNKITKKISAKRIWNLISKTAWQTGDPGVIFLDEINKKNPTKHVGKIKSTNPCGEQPLHPYESCNLGSINLSKFVKGNKLEWNRLKETIHKAIHFLDNVIDINNFPLPEIEKVTKANRRIGLGVMGFADLLIQLNIPYNSNKAIKLAKKLMKFISNEAHKKSEELGKKRGSFPNFKSSLWHKKGYKYMRNATCTTIAPTGTISIIANCSSGIEPLFAVSFIRNVLEGARLLEVNNQFEKIAKEQDFYAADLMFKIAHSGSIHDFKKIPTKIRKLFVTAFDISPEWHVKMQAIFQKYTDNAVSKTINFPHDAKVSSVRKAYE
ncbi:adenosylcobalamin-dependent ribonucleoside-diphosphate reductase, partial [Candidatus Woesearchaeota archaeon]|nr:adenosylcobalamin-dependent ribonucleoside-diphosphate reductase [Candidatus Woesearchaeota archaeon]